MPGSGRAAPRSGTGAAVRRTASAWAATGAGSTRTILPSARPDRVVGVGRGVVAVEHRHHQAERLGLAEHQRRHPQPAAEPVAAVGTADRLDRDPGLAQDRDVAAGGAVGDAEPLAEPVGADAGRALDQLERQQRPGGRVARSSTPTACHGFRTGSVRIRSLGVAAHDRLLPGTAARRHRRRAPRWAASTGCAPPSAGRPAVSTRTASAPGSAPPSCRWAPCSSTSRSSRTTAPPRALDGGSIGLPWTEIHDGTPDWEFRTADDDSPEQLYALVRRRRGPVAGALRRRHRRGRARPADRAPRRRRPARAACGGCCRDLVEEYGRHTGHADLLREAVDGLVGEDPPADWEP